MPGFRNVSELKHYLYRSDAKIEMLYQQLSDKRISKVTWEAKIGLDSNSISRKSERLNDFDATDKMKAVVNQLFEQGQIGLLDQEGLPYLYATMTMRWGMYNDLGERPAEDPPLVYFSGLSKGVLVGLGGSSRHVIGMYGSTHRITICDANARPLAIVRHSDGPTSKRTCSLSDSRRRRPSGGGSRRL